LQIWIQGVSHDALRGDGGFCILGLLDVNHPKLKPTTESYSEIEGQDEMQAMSKAEKQLESYADDSFTPSLRDVEQMLRELKVEHPRS
ncbi:MAG: hypothetical protein Q8M07_09745, partial [Prosthecobacter sp.]|nr:hypothetical protein [Prosthecobacter sp.]